MQWFPGTVTTAIQISRKNHALLIVYIETDDENGQQLSALWKDVDSQNLPCPVVGIKLKSEEQAAKQFGEIYPTPILPATYFIDQAGKPIEIITHLIGLNNDNFRSKLNNAVATFMKNAPAPPPVAPATTTTTTTDASPLPTSTLPSNSDSAPAQNQSTQEIIQAETQRSAEVEEKVKRAKELLSQKKKLDAEKKIEEEKAQELERIKNAKLLQETKKDRDDKAFIEAAKQRAKEKLELEKERERVRAQIKADREEKKKREMNIQENVEKREPEVPKPIPSDRCRLQVRMPDGSVLIEEFPSGDNLLSLVEVIRQKTQISGSFSLSQLYPRRVFSPDDFAKSFLENSLTPSSSLVVIQQPSIIKSSLKVSNTPNFVALITWLLMTPINFVFRLATSVFGAAGNGASNQGKKDESSPNNAAGDGQPRARGMPRSAEVRRRGNVAGLDNPNDDDPEERASFNGNSTQFM